jgi:aminoglycoside 6'-N-acetyltransferase
VAERNGQDENVASENRGVHIMGEQVVVRSIVDSDLPALERVMACPGVRAWWWDFEIGKFAAELDDPDLVALVIELDGEVVGYMQFSEEASLAYHFASIDLSLHDDFQGRGLGRDAIRTLARYLFDARGHHRLTIDPALSNERAIRCYESVGFQRVGVMREYERGVDGTWHNGLFMELLASDLR